MKLSIIIPVYNVEAYIDKCLYSVFEENSTEDVDVIVVNDGTNDNSMAVVDKYKHHENLVIINQENAGLSMARNAGLAESKGEYVWFVDSDDWLREGAVARILALIDNTPNIDVIATGLVWTYSDAPEKNHNDIVIESDLLMNGKDYLKKGFATGASQRFIIRKALLESFNWKFYPGILHEDGLFGLPILYKSKSVLVLAESTYYYRQRGGGSIMANLKIRSSYDQVTVHKKLVRFCDAYVDKKDEIWFRNKMFIVLQCSISFVRRLWNTKEYQQMLAETKKYRHQECDYLLSIDKNIKHKIKYFAFKYFPTLYIRMITNILKSLK